MEVLDFECLQENPNTGISCQFVKRQKLAALKHSAGFLVHFHAAITSSMTELQNVFNTPKSWLCEHFQIGVPRSFFSEIMSKLK